MSAATDSHVGAYAGHPRRHARAYANMALETRVLGANPSQLISLLFEGALAALTKAQLYLEKGRVAERGAMISRAIEIIDGGLKSSLNHDLDSRAGQALAQQLAHSYDVIMAHLLHANLHADGQRLALGRQMLATLHEGWQQNLRNLAAQS